MISLSVGGLNCESGLKVYFLDEACLLSRAQCSNGVDPPPVVNEKNTLNSDTQLIHIPQNFWSTKVCSLLVAMTCEGEGVRFSAVQKKQQYR